MLLINSQLLTRMSPMNNTINICHPCLLHECLLQLSVHIHCKSCSFIHNWKDDQLNMVGQWQGCESHPMAFVPMKQHSFVRYQIVFVIGSLFKRMMGCCIICVYRLALPSINAVSTLSRSKCHIRIIKYLWIIKLHTFIWNYLHPCLQYSLSGHQMIWSHHS